MNISKNHPPKAKKPHKCDFCDKFFSTAGNMREHRRTHTGERPFVCRFCNRTFAQSSTHSKHLLVHKNQNRPTHQGGAEMVLRQPPSKVRSGLSKGGSPSSYQSFSEPSLLKFTPETLLKTISSATSCQQQIVKSEVDILDKLDWVDSFKTPTVFVDQSDNEPSSQFDVGCDSAVGPVSSYSHATDQQPVAEQKPIITGMFKNRACSFLSAFPPQRQDLRMKQEVEIKDKGTNLDTFPIVKETDFPGNECLVKREKRLNKTLDVSDPSFRSAMKNISRDDMREQFHSVLDQPALSQISGYNQSPRNGSPLPPPPPNDTDVIELDLTSPESDSPQEMQENLQNNVETFFKCIHCSETFSSQEEHVCSAKEAKMFFKCQICRETFTQYGPFLRHKRKHEKMSPNPGGASIVRNGDFENCIDSFAVTEHTTDISRIIEDDFEQSQINASCIVDISSFPESESSRVQSSIQLLHEEGSVNDDDVIIIDEKETVQLANETGSKNLISIENQSENFLPIYSRADSEEPNDIRGDGFFQGCNQSSDSSCLDPGQSFGSMPKPDIARNKTANVSGKRPSPLAKKLQKIGKKPYPFTCLFCPREFSTASNMREHMRVHTGEKPFSCEVCHKRFAQSSTRSKHMQIHTGRRIGGGLLYTKRLLTHNKNLKKPPPPPLKKSMKDPESSKRLRNTERTEPFRPNRFESPNEKRSRILQERFLSMTTAPFSRKRYSGWPESDANRPSSKKYTPDKTVPNPLDSCTLSLPKSINTEICTINPNMYRRDNANNVFVSTEYLKPKSNFLLNKTDFISDDNCRNNSQQFLDTKISLPIVTCSASNVPAFVPRFERMRSPTTQFRSPTPITTPRPTKSRYRGAHRLLRNARNFRPFRCTYCPRTFSTSGNMREHTRTHTGERPFRCEFCGRRFAQSSTHSKHVQIHIRKQQLNCFLCGKIFSQVALLRNHIAADHTTEDFTGNPVEPIQPNTIKESLSEENRTISALSEHAVLDSKDGNLELLEAVSKNNETTEIAKSSLEGQRTVLEIDIPRNQKDFQLSETSESFSSLQDREISNSSLGKNQGGISMIGAGAARKTKDSLVSKNISTSSVPESIRTTRQENPGSLPESSTECEWLLAYPNRVADLPNATKIQSDFSSTHSKTKNPESFDSSISKDNDSFHEIKPVGFSYSFMEPISSSSLARGDSFTESSITGQNAVLGNVSLNETKQLILKPSENDIINGGQGNPIKPGLELQRNIKDDFAVYSQALISLVKDSKQQGTMDSNQTCDDSIDRKTDTFMASLDKRTTYSCAVNSDPLLPTVSGSSGSVGRFPTESQIGGANQIRKMSENTNFVSPKETTNQMEPSESDLGNELSSDLVSSKIEQSGTLIFEHQNSEPSSVPGFFYPTGQSVRTCSGDPINMLNNDWLPNVAVETRPINEETVNFANSSNNKFFDSKMVNLQNDGIISSTMPYTIKIEVDGGNENLPTVSEDGRLEKAIEIDSTQLVRTNNLDFNANVTHQSLINEGRNSKVSLDDPRQLCGQKEMDNPNHTQIISTKKAITRSSNPSAICIDGPKIQADPGQLKTGPLAKQAQKGLEHTKDVRKFKCPYCSRHFSSRSNMREHVRVHTGERPFECVFCLRRFAQSSTHSKHVKMHLRFRQLLCPQCGKRFPKASTLCQHIKTSHRNPHHTASTSDGLARKDVTDVSHFSLTAQSGSTDNNRKHRAGLQDAANNDLDIDRIENVDKLKESLRGVCTVLDVQEFLEKPESDIHLEKNHSMELMLDSKKNDSDSILDFEIPSSDSPKLYKSTSCSSPTPTCLSLSERCSAPFHAPPTLPYPSSEVLTCGLPSSSTPHHLAPTPTSDYGRSVKEQSKLNSTLLFHRCLFCTRMFNATVRTKGQVQSPKRKQDNLLPKHDRKLRQTSIWLKHIALIFGVGSPLVSAHSFLKKENHHLKVALSVSERLKLLLHRGIYKCNLCTKECITWRSLVFHKNAHLKKHNGRHKNQSQLTGVIIKRGILRKRPTDSVVFKTFCSDNEKSCSPSFGSKLEVGVKEDAEESGKVLLPLFLSQGNRLGFVDLNGRGLRLLDSYLRLKGNNDGSESEFALIPKPGPLFSDQKNPGKAKPKKFHLSSDGTKDAFKCSLENKPESLLLKNLVHAKKDLCDSGDDADGNNGSAHSNNDDNNGGCVCIDGDDADGNNSSTFSNNNDDGNNSSKHNNDDDDDGNNSSKHNNDDDGNNNSKHSNNDDDGGCVCIDGDDNNDDDDDGNNSSKHNNDDDDGNNSSKHSNNNNDDDGGCVCIDGDEADDNNSSAHSNNNDVGGGGGIDGDDKMDSNDFKELPNKRSTECSNRNGLLPSQRDVYRTVSLQLLKCKECDKTFPNVRGLGKHSRVHTGKIPVLCKLCGKTFNSFGTFFRHKVLFHSKRNPNSCIFSRKTIKPVHNSSNGNDHSNLQETIELETTKPGINSSSGVKAATTYATCLLKGTPNNVARHTTSVSIERAEAGDLQTCLETVGCSQQPPDQYLTESSFSQSLLQKSLVESKSEIKESKVEKNSTDGCSSFKERSVDICAQNILQPAATVKLEVERGLKDKDEVNDYVKRQFELFKISMTTVDDDVLLPEAPVKLEHESSLNKPKRRDEVNDNVRSESVLFKEISRTTLNDNVLVSEALVKLEDESSLNKLKDRHEVTDNVKIESDPFKKFSVATVDDDVAEEREIKANALSNQSIDPIAKQFSFEAVTNLKTRNQSSISANGDSSCGTDEEIRLKQDRFVECIFICDDPEDPESFNQGSSSNHHLPEGNEKIDRSSQIIIVSDGEDEENSTQLRTSLSSNLESSCTDTVLDNFSIKENQTDVNTVSNSEPEIFPSIYKPFSLSFQKNPLSIADIKNLHSHLNEYSLTTPSALPSVNSTIETNSLQARELPSQKAPPWPNTVPMAKIYACVYCPKMCSNSSNLKEHMRSHTGERPFSCKVCHKTFAQKSTLSKHSQIHTRFKRFANANVSIAESPLLSGSNRTGSSPSNTLPHLQFGPSLLIKQETEQTFSTNTDRKRINPKTDSCKITADNCDSLALIGNDSDIKSIINFDTSELVRLHTMDDDASTMDYPILSSSILSQDEFPYRKNSNITKSTPKNSNLSKSTPKNSNLSKSTPKNSTLSKSTPKNSNLSKSTPKNSTLSKSTPKNSTLSKSTPKNSTLSKSTPKNSNLSKSTPKRLPYVPQTSRAGSSSAANKPHACDICDRTFTTSGNLKEHRRTHTGERPFECPFCEKTFVQASTRSRHVKNHLKHFV